MKNFNIAVLISGIVFSLMNISCAHLIGNGKIISAERTLPAFEKIHSGGSANVRFHVSQEYRAVITVYSNIEEYIVTDIKNRELNIRLKNGRSYSPANFIVDVYCPGISGVSISGSGSFEGIDKIFTDTFASTVSGSGEITGNIECDDISIRISGSGKFNGNIVCSNLAANISGSGKINVTGSGKDANMSILGSGNFNGIDFDCNTANIHISGSGNVFLCAAEYINANISGSGSVKYRGNPKIDYSGSGSDRLINE
jgi:hypothetical protein